MVIPYQYRQNMKKRKECVEESDGEAGQTKEKACMAEESIYGSSPHG